LDYYYYIVETEIFYFSLTVTCFSTTKNYSVGPQKFRN